MTPSRASVKVVPLDDDRNLLVGGVDDDKRVDDLARFIDGVVFPDGQDEVGVLRVDRKVGVAVDAGFCVRNRRIGKVTGQVNRIRILKHQT